MSGYEGFVFVNLMLTVAVLGFLVFIAIPQSLDIRLSRRIGAYRDELYEIEKRTPNTIACRDVEAVDEFLRLTLTTERPLGLASAVSVLVNLKRLRSDATGELARDARLFRGLNQVDQRRIAEIQEDCLELLFWRAFLGSALWFLAWPGGFIASRVFRRADDDSVQIEGRDAAAPQPESTVGAELFFVVEKAAIAMAPPARTYATT